MSDKRPEKIYLTDAFEDDGLFWVNKRESDSDTEYIRKDTADADLHLKWHWMMDYCKEKGLSVAYPDNWYRAEKEWRLRNE